MAVRLLLPAALLCLLIAIGEVSAAAAPAGVVPRPHPAQIHPPAQQRRAHHRRHLSRHRRHLQDFGHQDHTAVARRQVKDSREAHRRWLNRDEVELVRRAAPSSLPPVCLGTAPAYAQCGGTGFTGDTCCVTGYACTYANDYYSQCLPSVATPSSSTTTSASAAPSQTPTGCTGAQTAYGQCGGTGYTGASCCPSGYFCSYSNPFYSQCVPTTSPSGSSSTPPPTSPSSSSSKTTSSASSPPSSSASRTSTTTSAAPSASTCSGIQLGYGQCGGIGWSGPTCCPSGWTCTYSNDFYSQCLPASSPSPSSTSSTSSSSTPASSASSSASSTPASSSSTPGTCSGSAGAYGQCGGSGYIGGTCCPSGYYCAFANAYYSQCLPGSSAPAPTSSSSTASSSQTPPASSTSKSTSASATPSAASCSGMQTGYGQCGGTGWSGPTCCPASFVCTYSNAFYSQCLPVSGFSTTSTTPSSSTSSSSSTRASSSTSSATSPVSTAAAFGQCGGQGFTAATCPSGFLCAVVNSYYSQCLPVVPSVTYTTALPSGVSTSSATKTSTSSAPSPTCGTCNIASGGSDGCTPYTVSYSGVTLPQGQTYPAGGHVNYQAIPKSQYLAGQTYLKPGSNWTARSFGMQFDPNNNQPGGVYIGRNFFDFSQAAAAFPQGYCITWVQLAQYNQHFGEGGQCPICTP